MSIEEIRCNHLLIQMPTTPSSYAHPPACLPSSSSIPPTPPNFPFPSPPCSPGPGVKGVGRAGGVTLRSPATRHLTHLDPWRRHSWEPGAIVTVQQKGMEPSDNRSVSLENLDPEEMEKVLGVALDVRRGGRDPRRNPITQEGSLSSLTEEEAGSDVQHYSILEEQSNQLQGCSASAPTLSVARHRNLQSTAPRPRSDCYETLPYRQLGGSTQSVDSDLGLLLWGREGSWTEVERDEAREERTGSPLERTFSFLRKMAGNRKNKEKERMREREKEARDREARYSNGHLFTSLTVSGTTLCSACNKSITAKEALSCPTCSVTIHNRCRDTLPNCAKMKQRTPFPLSFPFLLFHYISLPSSSFPSSSYSSSPPSSYIYSLLAPMMRERPSSAIYHSDNLRQSLLGSRRGRSGLSLSKSVSTNNITGNLNDDSPLGLRRILSQSTDSLNFRNRAMSMESLNDEGEEYYTSMLEEMEIEGRDFEADSWSMAVDSGYLQTHRKDIIKRQDVIYELIQTELHHVRTLRIMERVFRQGMLEEVQLEPGVVHAIFPCLDRLTAIHARFLAQLLTRRNHSLQPGSTYNFTIHQLGDVLLEQFSGQCADEMRKTYAEFCSRHLKAVKLYKELLARDKRFQYFIRRVCRGHLLRRHGVQECILLVTQRITKYPVLIQRILDNTKDNEEEASCLAQSLTQIRELLTSVDQQLERTQRLQEIRARLDPRAEAKVRDGGLFRGGELLRRRLIHEGMLLWKTPGSRLKDVQVLLMTDILVFLQEKDQRFIFPCLDKSPVLSLQNLMIREIANQERGLFLISDSSPPEMYEVHAASKDDKNTWIRLIQHTVRSCPSREEFPLIETEDKALLRRLKADIQQKDREVLELLQERVTLFSDLAEVTGGQEIMLPGGPNSRNLFRADMPQVPLGERLLTDAIAEGEGLVEVYQRLVNLSAHLHALQVSGFDAPTTPTGRVWRSLSRDAGMAEASTGAAIGELALLQRQHSLLQEELGRLRGADGRLRDSEKARAQLERQVRDMKVHSTTVFDSVGPAGSEQVELLTGTVGSSSETNADTKLASQESIEHSEGHQEGSDVEVEVTSDEEEEEEKEAKASPRSESPRGV
uniref:Uncharacterized protein n=1 Tax=Oncorhynchus tshawytscha TaxID=74940 RepID=A0A8C8J975_ONCTS